MRQADRQGGTIPCEKEVADMPSTGTTIVLDTDATRATPATTRGVGDVHHPTDRRRAAAAVVGGQTLVFTLCTTVTLAGSGQARRSGNTTLARQELLSAVGFGLATILAMVVTAGLLHRLRWSRPLAVLFEGIFLLNAITLVVDQTPLAVAGIVVGVVGIVLLATGTATNTSLPVMASIPLAGPPRAKPPRAKPPHANPTTNPTTTEPGSARRSASGRRLRFGVLLGAAATAIIVSAAVLIRAGGVFGLILLAVIFIPLERMFALHPDQRILRRHWGNDIVHFLVNNIVTVALTVGGAIAVVIAGSWMIRPSFQAAVQAQPFLLQLAEVLLVADFIAYAVHRAHHQVGWMWKFHAVHHSIEEMDWLAAARLHPVNQALDRALLGGVVYLMGFANLTIGALAAVFGFAAILIHANVRFRFGPLRWIVATPEFHHWHHANEPAAFDTNFAGQFPLLDTLFGTMHMPKHRMPAAYGCNDPVPGTWLSQMAYPFRRS